MKGAFLLLLLIGAAFPGFAADQVKRLKLDGVKFTRVPGVKEPIVTTNVETLLQRP